MRLFSSLYARAMQWARHRHAPAYLGTMSFAESSFFPVPPDVMLAPMCLARPDRAWRFALLPFTPASIIGRGARMEAALHRYVDRLGWVSVALVAAGLLVVQA